MPGSPGGSAPPAAYSRPSGSIRDTQARFDLLAKLQRMLERRHNQLRGCLQYLASLGGFPSTFASLESLPLPLLEDLHRAMIADDLAVSLLIQSTVVPGSNATSATSAAQDVLRDPDASLLVMLRKGLVQLLLSWYEVLLGILPFASLFLLALKIFKMNRGNTTARRV